MNRILLALFACAAPLSAQEFTVEVVPQFVVTVEPTDLPVVRVSQKRWVAMFTASYCGPCQSWKASEKHKLESRGYFVREYEMTESKHRNKYGSRVSRYPTFVVCDWETGEWLEKPIVGFTSAGSLITLLEQNKVQLTAMSHSEMVSLHNQLHGGGDWSWTGDLRRHLETKHRVETVKAGD